MHIVPPVRRTRRLMTLSVCLLLLGLIRLAFPLSACQAQGRLSNSTLVPSSNAALHYNRALLSLSRVHPELREILLLPMWEELGKMTENDMAERLPKLVHSSRHALQAAVTGSHQSEADFGVDYSDQDLGGLPHVAAMLQLGRLVTLAGWEAQRVGDWNNAAMYYLAGLRIGSHLTRQPTLPEAVTGIEIMENNYYALANWAARCTDRDLVKEVAMAIELLADEPLTPARTLMAEAQLIGMRCQKLKDAFPEGNWAEMLLEAVGKYPEGAERLSKKELEEAVSKVLAERGIPQDVLNDKAKFDDQIDRICGLWQECYGAMASSMRFPAQARVERGNKIYNEFREKLARLGDPDVLDPRQIGTFYAIHDAERTMLRVVLALAAARSDGKFPQKLDEVAGYFGGYVPASPYDHQPLSYSRSNDGRDFTLMVNAAQVGDAKLPEVKFSTTGK